MHRKSQKMNKQRGVGLIEVLVAILILAVAALGFVLMQVKSLRGIDQAFYQSNAMMIVSDTISRMEINLSQLDAYADTKNWKLKPNSTNKIKSCYTNNCSTAELREWDIYQLKLMAEKNLPFGDVEVVKRAGFFEVVVVWDETTLPSKKEDQTSCEITSDEAKKNKCVVVNFIPPYATIKGN